ncbi:CapA family protein [Paenibacillus glycinis]|uniref:CapA family protein n=1 Tax=Paenibacillus glycinis TaxID=2697035 RepID=A0ABW9XRV5_9BACL|nr:CapA family protein [Paenibacillus glycinis]NBD25360.1 CapA family protein [Paenibacillus glycinis]
MNEIAANATTAVETKDSAEPVPGHARHARKEIVVAAVGDLLMKPLLIRTVRTSSPAKGDAAYAFDQVFEPVARYLREADLTIGNLETTFSGGTDERSYTTTIRNPKNRNPVFNCPDAFAPALKAAGFGVLATANNHCMDYGVRGLKRTLEVLDKHGIAHVGTYRGNEESRSLCIRNVEGIRVGILSYTRGTNGVPVPKGQPAGVKKIVPSLIKKQMKRLRAKSDFIIVCMHFGSEYHRRPNAGQKRMVRFLFRQGADVILGAHPHVLQPAVCRSVTDIDGRTRKRFAIYSLGNFISTRLHGKDAALTGLILRLTIRGTAGGSAELSKVDFIPTWVSLAKNGKRTRCRVVPLPRALQEPNGYASGQANRMRRAYRGTVLLYKGVMSPHGESPSG